VTTLLGICADNVLRRSIQEACERDRGRHVLEMQHKLRLQLESLGDNGAAVIDKLTDQEDDLHNLRGCTTLVIAAPPEAEHRDQPTHSPKRTTFRICVTALLLAITAPPEP